MKVLALVGSLRRDSFNKKLLAAAIEEAPEGMEISTFDIGTLPLYNQDLEADMPASVAALHDAIRPVDAILFVTPEYNYGVPGVLKNAIDWASRPPQKSPIYGKPAAIMGATPGRNGTIRAQTHLRVNLQFLDMPVVIERELLLAQAGTKFDESGRLNDDIARKIIRDIWEALVTLTKRYAINP